MTKCDVCNKNEGIGVGASRCGAVSFSYCRECLEAGAEPYYALVAYLSMAVERGSDLEPEAEKIHGQYQRIIDASLKVAGKDRKEFYADVDKSIKEFEEEYYGEGPETMT